MASEDLGKDLISVNNLLKKHAVSITEGVHEHTQVHTHVRICIPIQQANSHSYIECKLVHTVHCASLFTWTTENFINNFSNNVA